MKRYTILIIIGFVFILANIFMRGTNVVQGEASFPEPHIPQNMIDLEHPELGADFEPLAEPILTLGRAVEFVLPYDQITATWEDPWSYADVSGNFTRGSLEQPWRAGAVLEAERFTVGYFPSRAEAYQHLFNEKIWVTPDIETQDGNVWVVTIRGHVQARFMGGPNDTTVYDSITYQVSARTGKLLGIRTGLPIIDENGNVILRDEQGNVIDGQGNIIWEVTK